VDGRKCTELVHITTPSEITAINSTALDEVHTAESNSTTVDFIRAGQDELKFNFRINVNSKSI
jgi:hypothetical protein